MNAVTGDANEIKKYILYGTKHKLLCIFKCKVQKMLQQTILTHLSQIFKKQGLRVTFFFLTRALFRREYERPTLKSTYR